MRKFALFAALLVGCSKAETPPADTAATVAPAPPPNLTPGDIAGTWNGASKLAGTDSVLARWVTTWSGDSTGTVLYEGTKKPVALKAVFSGDSVMFMPVEPFDAPNARKGAPKVAFTAVGRVRDGKFVGNSTMFLASKPDSVLARREFEGTRAP